MKEVGGRRITLMIVPDGGRETKTLSISIRALRALAAASAVLGLALTVMAGSWWYLAARAARAGELQREVEVMTRDRARVEALVHRLETIEEQYGNIRNLFGNADTDIPSRVWLPPVTSSRRSSASEDRPMDRFLGLTTWGDGRESLYVEKTAVEDSDAAAALWRENVVFNDDPPAGSRDINFMLGSHGFHPGIYVDISDHLDIKLEALRLHASQMRPSVHHGSVQSVEYWARVRGREVSVEAAEGYMCLRLLI